MQIEELGSTQQALEDIPESKWDLELLVPLSSGIFVKAALKQNDKIILNVGAGTAVEKSIDETKELVDKQKMELATVRDQLAQQVQMLNARAHAIQNAVEQAGIQQ